MSRLFLLVLLSLWLSGCAHEMSLDEARKVSLSMSDGSFNEPPRKIDDILNSIEQHKLSSAALQENIRLAEEQPTNQKGESLGRFYYTRAQAAAITGRTSQAVSDLRMALNYLTDWSGYNNRGAAFQQLAWVELDNGNYNAAIQAMSEAFNEGRLRYQYFSGIGMRVQFSQIYRIIGDYGSAQNHIATALNDYNRITNYGANPSRYTDPPPAHVFSDLDASDYEVQGNWAKAERSIREAIIRIKQSYTGDKNRQAILILKYKNRLSTNLIQQGKFVDAEIVAREALFDILRESGTDNMYTIKSINLMAEIYLMQGRLKDAVVIAQKALDILHRLGVRENAPEVFFSHFILGKALLLGRDWNGAFEHFSHIISHKQDDGSVYLRNYYNDLNIGIALAKAGQHKEAEELFQREYTALSKQLGQDHYDTAEMKALLAIPKASQGKSKEALSMLRESYPVLMASIGSKETTKDTERSFRLKLITNAYLDLLSERNSDNDASDEQLTEAFRITEAARAGTVQKAIVDVSLRNLAEQSKELGGLIRQYQDLQIQIEVSGELLSMLLWSTEEASLAEIVSKLSERIKTYRAASDALLKEIKNRVPGYDKLVNPTLITAEDVRQSLKPGEVLISIYPTDTQTFIWAVPYKGSPQIFRSTLNEGDIDRAVTTLRKSLDSNPQTFGDIPEFDLTVAYNLYEKLLKPTEPVWHDASSIVFVTNGSLGQLPLYVLPTAPIKLSPEQGMLFGNYRELPWLIKKIAITTTPSLDSFRKIRSISLQGKTRQPYVGFGDPIFSPKQLDRNKQELIETRSITIRGVRNTEQGSLDSSTIVSSQLSQLKRLPDTAEEIQKVATILGADLRKDVFLRERASKGTVQSMNLSDRKVIAFATHALVPGDLDGLDQPALALSAPSVTKDGEDGLLTVKDILKLKLNADWVILSACNTGAADSSGKEAISGLGRAFFYAGAKSLLVSMWPVETTSAMKLVTETFRLHKEERLSRAEALRQSMLKLIDSEIRFDTTTGRKVVSYAHPLFWAPFVLAGDGSGKFE